MLSRHLSDPVLHPQCGTYGTSRVVILLFRSAKKCDEGIADVLVEGPIFEEDLSCELFKQLVEQIDHFTGSHLF